MAPPASVDNMLIVVVKRRVLRTRAFDVRAKYRQDLIGAAYDAYESGERSALGHLVQSQDPNQYHYSGWPAWNRCTRF